MSSELVTILEQEAATEVEQILTEARSQAEQVTSDAQREAEAFLEAQRQQLEAERKAAQTRADSSAALQFSALILQAKDQAIAEVFAKAEAELTKLSSDRTRYAPILRGLIREAADGLDGRLVVEVHPSDLETARAVVRELKLDADVKATDDVRGGARLSSGDGRFVVENTLASRIERVKSALAPEVAALLWAQ